MRQLCHDAAIGAEGRSERTDRKNGLRRSGGRKEAAEFGGFVQGERVEESRFEQYIACGGMVGDGGFTPQGGINFDSTVIQPKNKSKRQKSFGFIWWGMVDSNHRRHRQQIYSLSPLATREIPHTYEVDWSWWTDSNPRPADYKSAALPAELHQHRTSIMHTNTQFLFCQ